MTATVTRSPELIEAMAPQPVPGMEGIRCWFSFTAVGQSCDATGIPIASQLLGALLTGQPRAIEECAARALLNPDNSRWAGGVDSIPIAILPLGRLLGDALHRRLFGEALPPLNGEGE